MKRHALVAVIICFSILLSTITVLSHHSFSAQYDRSKPIKFTGKVSRVEWMNPHVYFFVDVQDSATGKTINYACEVGAPNGLYRSGWRKDTLKQGDTVSVEGWRAKDGSDTVNAGNVTFSGKRIFSGSAEDGGPNSRQ